MDQKKRASFEAVYFVKSYVHRVEPIAIRPTFLSMIFEEGEVLRCEWEDTLGGNFFDYNELVVDEEGEPPRSFTLLLGGEAAIEFQFLTKELFEQKLRRQVWNRKDFTSTEELQNYYLNTQFET